MHEKFPSLHRGSYKANLLKMVELDGERNFFQGLMDKRTNELAVVVKDIRALRDSFEP